MTFEIKTRITFTKSETGRRTMTFLSSAFVVVRC